MWNSTICNSHLEYRMYDWTLDDLDFSIKSKNSHTQHTERTTASTITSFTRIRLPIRVEFATVTGFSVLSGLHSSTHSTCAVYLVARKSKYNIGFYVSNEAIDEFTRQKQLCRNRKLFSWNKRQSNNAKCIDPRACRLLLHLYSYFPRWILRFPFVSIIQSLVSLKT